MFIKCGWHNFSVKRQLLLYSGRPEHLSEIMVMGPDMRLVTKIFMGKMNPEIRGRIGMIGHMQVVPVGSKRILDIRIRIGALMSLARLDAYLWTLNDQSADAKRFAQDIWRVYGAGTMGASPSQKENMIFDTLMSEALGNINELFSVDPKAAGTLVEKLQGADGSEGGRERMRHVVEWASRKLFGSWLKVVSSRFAIWRKIRELGRHFGKDTDFLGVKVDDGMPKLRFSPHDGNPAQFHAQVNREFLVLDSTEVFDICRQIENDNFHHALFAAPKNTLDEATPLLFLSGIELFRVEGPQSQETSLPRLSLN